MRAGDGYLTNRRAQARTRWPRSRRRSSAGPTRRGYHARRRRISHQPEGSRANAVAIMPRSSSKLWKGGHRASSRRVSGGAPRYRYSCKPFPLGDGDASPAATLFPTRKTSGFTAFTTEVFIARSPGVILLPDRIAGRIVYGRGAPGRAPCLRKRMWWRWYSTTRK